MLSWGNTKLGKIANFSLPAYETCPGTTEFCWRYCYGNRNWYRFRRMFNILERNLGYTKSPSFVDKLSRELEMHKPKVVRIHVVGDFYSPEYIEKWIRVVSKFKDTKFYAYTKSWRVDTLLSSLTELEQLPNMQLWASTDFTHLDKPPKGWRIVSVAIGNYELCPHDYNEIEYCIECGRCWTNGTSNMRLNLRWGKRMDNLSPSLFPTLFLNKANPLVKDKAYKIMRR